MKQLEPHNAVLVRLSETNLTLADEVQDICTRKVVDSDGAEIGHVDEVFIDEHERKVRMLEIRAGGFLGLGQRHFLLPIDTVTSVTDNEVCVNETLERIVGSPVYQPRLIEKPPRETWEPYYVYFGVSPYWGSGYTYPKFPIQQAELRDRFIR